MAGHSCTPPEFYERWQHCMHYVPQFVTSCIETKRGERKDMPEADYKAALLGFGLPAFVAALLSDSDAAASKGALFDDQRQLSALIGRPTTPMPTTVKATLAA